MNIRAKKEGELDISVTHDGTGIIVGVRSPSGDVAVVELDGNHTEALETALCAARLEAQARGLTP